MTYFGPILRGPNGVFGVSGTMESRGYPVDGPRGHCKGICPLGNSIGCHLASQIGSPIWGLPRGSILDPKLVDFGVPDLDLNVDPSGFGGPDPQIDGFGPLLGSKSGGAELAGLPKSLCTVVQPARWSIRRGQNPSKIVTKMGYFGGPDPQIWM